MTIRHKLYLLVTIICILLLFPLKVIAFWDKYIDNPVVKTGDINTWDDYSVGSPFLIFENGLFKLWYEGSDQSKWRIGYATSSSGLSWTKNNSYVIDSLDNQQNINVHNPKVIHKKNQYLMWFSASDSTINNIHINLLHSNNGFEWINPIIGVLYPSLGWEIAQNKGVSFPFVLDVNNILHMWYGASGIYNNSIKWRIGYATSAEGETWDKHPLPVIDADQSWERVAGDFGVGNPSVIYENGQYHMFYHADRDIGHAVSYDGVDWTKDPENPVLSPELNNNQAFDQRRVMDPFVINRNGTYYMYYTGVRNDGKWQIGLATSSVLPTVIPPSVNSPTPTSSPTPSPTETPTPTPTSSPTPTPSLSPTPTPTIISDSVIVIIPGFGASWNTKDIFSCNTNSTGNWKLAPFVSVYKPIITTLTKNFGLKLNEDVFLYAYDWRQPLDKQSQSLKNYLEKILKNKQEGTKIKFIGHSFGGLVIRSYLTDFPDDARVEKVVTVGTPHEGMVFAYPLWEKGEIWTDDKIFKITVSQIINHCRIVRSPIHFQSAREVIQQVSPSVKDLLPVFDYIYKDNAIFDYKKLKAQNDWLNKNDTVPSNYLSRIFTLSGKGYDTLRYIYVSEPSATDKKNGDWVDGKPIKKISVRDGDNTVLNLSSDLIGAQNEQIDGNHQSIISSPFAVNKILSFIGLPQTTVSEIPVPEVTSRDVLTVSLSSTAKIEITDPKRNSFFFDDSIAVLYQPKTGLYRLKITPEESGTAQLYVFYVSDAELTKSINFPLRLTKGKTFNYLLPISSFQKPLPQVISIKN